MDTETSIRTAKNFSTEILDLLKHLKLAIAQVRLEPKDPLQISKAGAAALRSIHAFLEQNENLVLASAPDGLLVNGQRLGAKDFPTVTLESSLISFYLDGGIHNVVIRRGVALPEFLAFLDALVLKFWDLNDSRKVNERLRAEGVTSIAVDVLEFVAAPEVEPAAPVPETREPAPTASGLLSLDQARQGLAELGKLFMAAPENLRPGIRKVAAVLLEPFRQEPRVSATLRPFLASDAPDLMPLWLSRGTPDAAQDGGPAARAKVLLALAGDEQADRLVREAAPLAGDLLAHARADLAAKLLARLAGVLLDRSPDRRRAAAEALLALQPSWDKEPLSTTREGFETLLRSALDGEQDAAAYAKMADLAAILADGRLKRGEPELALETLSLLRRHHSVKDAAAPFRAEIAFLALERVARSPGFPPVLDGLRSGDPFALRIVEALGDSAAKSLVELLKKIETSATRLPLAEALSRIGPRAAAILSDELQNSSAPADALRLLEALSCAAPEDIATVALSSTLHHAVGEVRRCSASILTEKAYARSGDLLLQALPDEKEPTTRVMIVEGLGKLRVSGAFEALATIADSRAESDGLRAAACLSLAQLGHAEAIPILASIASKGSRGMGLLKSASPALRTAAIRALGHFPSNPIAREAIKKAMDDANPALKAAAKETLSNPTPSPVPGASALQEKPSTVKLGGSLQEVAFDQICQLVGTSEKTGLLMLSLEGRVARIWFEKGQVVAAEFEKLQDQDAFNAIARQKKGDFVFQPSERAPERRIQSPIHSMLLEAFRLADEHQK